MLITYGIWEVDAEYKLMMILNRNLYQLRLLANALCAGWRQFDK